MPASVTLERSSDLSRLEDAGARLARLCPVSDSRARSKTHPGALRGIFERATEAHARYRAWVLDNVRLIQAAGKNVREFAEGLREFPVCLDGSGVEVARVSLIARAYLNQVNNAFTEESCTAFLDGFQRVVVLTMNEIWGLKPALEMEVLERLAEVPPALWPELVTSLRRLAETAWKDLFEAVSRVDRVLERDPAGSYPRMDFQSRDFYRIAVGKLARHSSLSELEVARAALELSEEARLRSDGSRAALRRMHIGRYLVDEGLERLQARIHYRTPLGERITGFLLRHPAAFYLIGIETLALAVIPVMLSGRDSFAPILAGLLPLCLPATQAAVDFINSLLTFLIPPRVLPKLDFSSGIPAQCTTLVAVPALLLNEAQVRNLVLDLEIRFLANRDPNLYFALLTDSPDADRPCEEDHALVDLCRQLIEGLNRRYRSRTGTPFLLFHRHRVYNDSEGRWMGWERKRGKLLDLNRCLRGAADSFPVKAGSLPLPERIRYVITLDSDTQLPRDSAAKLIGTIAHPLNAAVVDPVRRIVVEGYGILQPRIGISIHAATRSRLAALYSGESGFDIYTRAVSDVYQDLFGEGIFTGKGIYEVDVLRDVLEQRFPENTLLSHDLIEGAYARVGLVSDIELIDDYPSHFSAYNRRKHRWVRGDWQITRWLFSRVPDFHRRLIPNPISLISRWKIVDNLRRSLLEPSLLLLLLAGWLYLPQPGYWTVAALTMLFLPAYSNLLFALLRAPRSLRALRGWLHDTARAFAKSHAIALFGLIFLLHQALVSIDAIARAVLRVFITRRRLLEWETAAEAEAEARAKSTVDVYLEWTPWLSMFIGVLLWRVRPSALSVAAPVLALWLSSRSISNWLNRPPRATNRELSREDTQWLRDIGERICRFFRDWSSPATNWLIPDSLSEDGEPVLSLSPTNLGMLLNARIAAVHMGLATAAEFAFETRQTLNQVLAMPKHRGHLYNWSDIASLEPLPPRFISTVDSGNLAASLWTLKQAALSFRDESGSKGGVTPALAGELIEIAAICDRLVREMDFRFLYNPRKKVLSVGYDLTAGRVEPSCYDLLASESRIAAFIAIAKGDIPQEAWFHLGRAHTLYRGERVLLSWTGTMFEYLMPALWMHHYPGTITEQSIRAVVRTQRSYAREKGVPWGISESACLRDVGSEPGYAPFGIPGLALKCSDPGALVISPYSTLLAAMVDAGAALQNLRRMEEYGWLGRYGFYEAVDYTHAGGNPLRVWMAHHQGMGLLAICNVLYDNPIRRYFHSEPHVMATELLLHERVPTAITAECDAEAVSA